MRKWFALSFVLALIFGVGAQSASAHRPWPAWAVKQGLDEHGSMPTANGKNGGDWGGICGWGSSWNCLDGTGGEGSDQNTGYSPPGIGGSNVGNRACLERALNSTGTDWIHKVGLRYRPQPNCPMAWLSDFDYNGTTKSGSHSYQFRGRFIEFEMAHVPEQDWYDPECRVGHIRANVSAHTTLPGGAGSEPGLPYVWRDKSGGYLLWYSKQFDCDKDDGTGNNPEGVVCYQGAPNCGTNARAASAAESTSGFGTTLDPDNVDDTEGGLTSDVVDQCYEVTDNGDGVGDGSPPSGWSATAVDPDKCVDDQDQVDTTIELTDNVQSTEVSAYPANPNDGSTMYNGTEWVDDTGAGYAPNNNLDVLDKDEAYATLWRVSRDDAIAAAEANGVDTDYSQDYRWAGTRFTRLYGGNTDADVCVTHTWDNSDRKVNVTYCRQVFEDTGNVVTANAYNYSVNGQVNVVTTP